MKTLHLFTLFLLLAALGRALPTTTSFEYYTEGVTIPAGGYDLSFAVTWFADDFPQAGAPGRIELVDGAGNVMGQVSATVHQASGPAVSASPGSVGDVQPAITIYSVNGTPADGSLQAVWHITGVPAGNYTLRFYEYRTDVQMTMNTTVWSLAYSTGGAPVATSAPTIAWTAAPGSAESGQSYTVSARGHDDDADLTQVNVWKNGQPFAFAGGGNGTDGDSGNATIDTGPQTVTYTAQAVDATGAVSTVISHTVAIAAPPPPATFTLTTGAGPGGSITAGGTYAAGSTVSITAIADATHDFAGWSGDAAGTANPLGVLLDRDKVIQAGFSLKVYALSTSATAGGSVTAGGSYPYGTLLTLAGTPDATHRFVGWKGDASSAAASITLLIDRTKWVQAIFAAKTAQSIAFASPSTPLVNGTPFPLNASASSGLPVSFTLVSGPGVLNGDQLTITGPGKVTVQADQSGDGDYLPAPGVARDFNAVALSAVKYQPAGRTFLQADATGGMPPYVLENP